MIALVQVFMPGDMYQLLGGEAPIRLLAENLTIKLDELGQNGSRYGDAHEHLVVALPVSTTEANSIIIDLRQVTASVTTLSYIEAELITMLKHQNLLDNGTRVYSLTEFGLHDFFTIGA